MEIKLNGIEIKELKNEIITASLKQEMRKEIQAVFDNEMKSNMKSLVENRFGSYTGKGLIDRVGKTTITEIIKENKVVEEKIKEIIDNISIDEVTLNVKQSVERKLLIDTKEQLERISNKLNTKLHTVDRLKGVL